MKRGVVIRTENGDEAASIYSIRRSGDKLIMDGSALGTMRMDMVMTVEDALQAAKMAFCWDVFCFAMLLPYYIIRNRIRGGEKKDDSKPNW